MGHLRISGGFLGCSFDEPRRETTKIRSVRKPRDKSNVERKYQILTEMVYTSVCVECFSPSAVSQFEVGVFHNSRYQAIRL